MNMSMVSGNANLLTVMVYIVSILCISYRQILGYAVLSPYFCVDSFENPWATPLFKPRVESFSALQIEESQAPLLFGAGQVRPDPTT